MKKIIYPEKKDWVEILRRPALNTDTLRDTVKEVLDKVKTEGDKAVREYEERFDKVKLDLLGVTETEIAEAEKEVPIELKAAIMLAQKIFILFIILSDLKEKVQTVSGVTCWQKAVAIEKVGLVYSRRHGAFIFYRIDVGYSGTDCRLQGNRTLYSS